MIKEISHGFHAHTNIGSLDAVCSAKEMINRSIELGRNALVVTDHGSMSALPTFWKTNIELGAPLQIIHGIEPYIKLKTFNIPQDTEGLKAYFHITVLFKTFKAYQFFCRKSLEAEQNGVKRFGNTKPIFYLEDFEEIKNDIIIGSGCMQGPVANLYNLGLKTLSLEVYKYLRNTFPHFYVELMPHKLNKEWVPPFKDRAGCYRDTQDIQKPINQYMYSLAKQFNDKIVISEDSHLVTEDQKDIQDVLLGNGISKWRFSIAYSMEKTKKWIDNLKEHIPGLNEQEIDKIVDNSYEISSLCKGYSFKTIDDQLLLPTMKMIYGEDKNSTKTLLEKIKEHNLIPQDERKEIYIKRLKEEIDVLINNGVADFIPYMLLIYEAVNEFKQKNIFVTPRGSAAGSLILYLLGVSIADPIKHNLKFARFLTKGRIKEKAFPDIDLDCAEQRIVFDYFKEKYKGCFCQIATESTMKLKSTIRDVERVSDGKVSPETEYIAKILPNPPQGTSDVEFVFGFKKNGTFIPGIIDSEEEYGVKIREWIDKNPKKWKIVSKCLGTIRSKGVHACACLITPEQVSDYVPLKTAKNNALITEYTHGLCEYLGAIKYDILSVDALKSISKTFTLISQNKGINLEWKEFDVDENVINEIIKKDKLDGIFQLSANALRPYVKKMPPTTITEISNILALIRPGALDAPSPRPNAPEEETAAMFYIKCVNGEAEPFYIHEDLKEITSKTYSVILYQEQIMQVFTKLANYNEGDAAAAMKAISKKKKKLLEQHCNNLRESCLKRGWSDDQATFLIKTIMASAKYSFNLSHSLSYAINAYIECHLKYHFPVEFWTAKVSVFSEKDGGLERIAVEAMKYIDNFDIKNCHQREFLIKDNKIIPPLSVLKGLGEKASSALISYSQKTSWHSFSELLETIVKNKKLEKLSKQETSLSFIQTKGINVSVLVTCLYHGVFDKYIEGEKNINTYLKYTDLIRKKLKSKAECKNINHIKSDCDLISFKLKDNPLFNFSKEYIYNKFKDTLLQHDYILTNKKARIAIKNDIKDVYNTLTPVYKNKQLLNLYSNNQRFISCIAFIENVTLLKTKKGDAMIRTTINLGNQEKYNFVVFSNRKTKQISSQVSVALREGNFCIIDFKINVFNNINGGIIDYVFCLNE